MTSAIPKSEIIYPSSDGEPVAETYDHLYALLTTLEVLRQYLQGRRATVLANQFLYYAQGFPKLRVAPDVMVIYDIEPGGRDNYKIWEEKQVPKVIFEITSKGTQEEDKTTKKNLYESLEVEEYWLFDPKGEWIEQQLQGYRLRGDIYEPITDNCSQILQLRLAVEGKLIGFYRLDNGEKLLVNDELIAALKQETDKRIQAEIQAEQERQRAAELESLLSRYREQFGELP
ncbi:MULTISPECIES: Uma2 family endonuclease [Calothrix]|uniref:Uma2 family endonuclease n=2 Tax=Calothrix TaxID=1186 RepID=A0ABR8A6H2_9CYAN|nr:MULTISPECIES: Uma2 family endonuclease [Calothrix]MBD2195229.1 Uma2 family endonuclease [Calothrix parietina FACHB-288]MBD2223800.1 Uma2 family endonuclease [Calothrix anomala FACHB-343]